ncbi:class I SAM-dependent methyltransferase [Angustibacter aerolatus]
MSTQASWTGSMPDVYDRLLGPVKFAPHARHVAALAADLAPRDVLELAAGTGISTAELVRALPGARVTATDLNPAMVAAGSARVPGATWQVADAQQLPQPAACADVVVCQFGVMFFPDKPAAHAQVRRVLRPGGVLLASIWDEVAATPFAAALDAALHEVLPDGPPDFVTAVPHGYHDPDRIRGDAEAGGLRVLAVDHVVLPGRAPSAAALAEGFCLGTPLRFALEQRGPLDALLPAVAAAMTRHLGDGEVHGDLAAWVLRAARPTD